MTVLRSTLQLEVQPPTAIGKTTLVRVLSVILAVTVSVVVLARAQTAIPLPLQSVMVLPLTVSPLIAQDEPDTLLIMLIQASWHPYLSKLRLPQLVKVLLLIVPEVMSTSPAAKPRLV